MLIDRPADGLAVKVDGQPARARIEAVDRFLRIEVRPPAYGAVLTVEERSTGRRIWTLNLAPDPRPAWLASAKAALRKGNYLEVEAILTTAGHDPWERAYALEVRRGLAWRQSRSAEAGELAVALSQEWRQLGAWSKAADEISNAVNGTVLRRDFAFGRQLVAEKSQLVAALAADGAEAADGALVLAYDRALLARATGDIRSALRDQGRIEDLAKHHGLLLEAWQTSQEKAILLATLGRLEEAIALLLRLREQAIPDAGPRDRALLLATLGRVMNLGLEAGQIRADPVPFLNEARYIELAEKGNPERIFNIGLHLTLAHLLLGRPEAARAAAASIESLLAHASPDQRFEWRILQARLALAENERVRATQLLEELERVAEVFGDSAMRWRVAFGLSEALAAAGKTDAALARLAAAEGWLNAQSLAIPIQEGREAFLAQRERASRFQVALLLDRGESSAALELVRRQRRRVLNGLIQGDRRTELDTASQARWDAAMADYATARESHDQAVGEASTLPVDQRTASAARNGERQALIDQALDELFRILDAPVISTDPPASTAPALPAEGELLLAFHPLPVGWVAFAATALGIKSAEFQLELPLPSAVELSRLLLEPFRSQIQAARRLRILPLGALQAVDFHALPWDGGALIDAKPLVYGVDIAGPVTADAPRVANGPRRALLVGDPAGDLQMARIEVERLEPLLTAQGWKVELLRGQEAGANRVRQAQAEVDFFHFAGHGIFAGRAGWGSVLELAASRLTIGDLLLLPHAPRWAVLSSCETGKTDAGLPLESLGIAQALIVAGSRQVLAATARVDDRFAGRLIQDFYAAWLADPDRDFAAALRQAQLQNRDSAGEWAKFRVFER